MFNLFEIMQNAQNGQAMDNLARQFNLTQQQTQAAVDALLPAFSMGLKRQAADPAAAPDLFGQMVNQTYANAFNNPMMEATAAMAEQGNEAVKALFGTTGMTQAVANQAAAASGVGAEVLKAMLPVVASMLMGGLFKSASAQPGLQDVFGQMTGGNAGNLGTILGGMFGQPAPQPQVQPNANGGGLLGGLPGSLLQQGAFQPQGGTARQPAPGTPQSPADILGQMFDTGRQMQQAHMDSLQSIFESFLGKKP